MVCLVRTEKGQGGADLVAAVLAVAEGADAQAALLVLRGREVRELVHGGVPGVDAADVVHAAARAAGHARDGEAPHVLVADQVPCGTRVEAWLSCGT